MEDKILMKWKSLEKYLPFIDYLLDLDREKYTKLNDIKQWIKTKKRYPINVLDKIEKCIATQYRNLFLEYDVKPPRNIMEIFTNTSAEMRCISVDLCSEDENDLVDKKISEDSDDDIEFVSVTPCETKSTVPKESAVIPSNELNSENPTETIDPNVSKSPRISPTATHKTIEADDKETIDLLKTIDQLVELVNNADMVEEKGLNEDSSHSWRDYNDFDIKGIDFVDNECQEKLFKRREDFIDSSRPRKKKKSKKSHKKHESKEVTDQKKHHKKKSTKKNRTIIGETILLDSSSEDDIGNGKKTNVPHISNATENNTEVVPDVTSDGVVQGPKNDTDGTLIKPATTLTPTPKSNDKHICDGLSTVSATVSSTNTSEIGPTNLEASSSSNDLENMNIEQLNQMFQNLSKHNSVEIEQCLKSLLSNVCSDQMGATEPIPPVCDGPQNTHQSGPTPQTTHFFPIDHTYPNMRKIFVPVPQYTPPPAPTNCQRVIHKLNLKDPRIMKQLQMIQNSSQYSGGARAAAANVAHWTVHAPGVPNLPKPVCSSQRLVTYGEYKRQKARKELEAERQKVENRIAAEKKRMAEVKANRQKWALLEARRKEKLELEAERIKKAEEEAKAHDKIESQKMTDDIRKILMNTLEPYGEKLENIIIHKRNQSASPEKGNDGNSDKAAQEDPTNKTKKIGDKIDKALKELECTVKGYNNIQDYLPIGGKRRSSVCASSAITEQLKALRGGPYSSTEDLYEEEYVIPKREKRVMKQPVLKLHRLTDAQIALHISKPTTTTSKSIDSGRDGEQRLLNIELVENKSKTINQKRTLSKPVSNKKLPRSHPRNIDNRMTERSTKLCVLCKSKPADLTNHYIRMHKSESYVARLTAQELDELQLNIPFAVAMTATSMGANTNSRTLRYKTTCPFCTVELVDSFTNFYTHYSSHTGEYAYKCSSCNLQKPYRADIQSHQLHTKSCRNKRILTLYQYPAKIMVIYLHCCDICNFVQLNEANVYKHLRDHHDKREDDASCVKKYILAVIRDGNEETTEEDQRTSFGEVPSSLALSMDDDEIAVNNEPILDDSVIEQNRPVEDLMNDLFNGDGQEFLNEPMLKPTKQTNKATEIQYPIRKAYANVAGSIGSEVSVPPITIIHSALSTDIAATPQRLSNVSNSRNDISENVYPHRPIQLPDIEIKPDISQLEGLLNANLRLPVAAVAVSEPNMEQQLHMESIGEVATVAQVEGSKAQTTSQPMHLTSKTKLPQHSTPHLSYKSYSTDTSYLGLYKCLAEDCFFSSDASVDMIFHLKQHGESECPPAGVLNCAYCQLDAEVDSSSTPETLVAHVTKRHGRSRFQCRKCSYRSCVPGNIMLHRQKMHPDVDPFEDYVYECYGNFTRISDRLPQMMKKMLENVPKISCPHCTMGFYAIQSLEDHLRTDHTINKDSSSIAHNQYVCIYCSESTAQKKDIQEHLALKHPDELPYVCERVLKGRLQVDSIQNLQLTNAAITVLPRNIRSISRISRELTPIRSQAESTPLAKVSAIGNASPQANATLRKSVLNVINDDISTCQSDSANELSAPSKSANTAEPTFEEDMKPDKEKIVCLYEEMVKPLLLKLTRDTGVPPDRLYCCPETNCGGFFSIYNLWRRHMMQRHSHLLVNCPHCSGTDVELPLEVFEQHFEKHCRHLYICFHCGETYANELQLRTHGAVLHSDISALMRLEKAPFSISYSYFVLIAEQLHTERLEFLLQLQDMLKKQLARQEQDKSLQVRTQWSVPVGSVWLEDFPTFSVNKDSEKKCITPGCPFRTRVDFELFEHLRTVHNIAGHQFKCSKCSITIKECQNWDGVIEHVKMHSSNLHICCVCSYYHYDRRKVTDHIRQAHDARDVPLLTLLRFKALKMGYQSNVAIAVVFAAGKKSFSSLSSCFCCTKTNLGMDTYALHLKNSHQLKLRYFCELCDESLQQLQQVEAHFSDKHANVAKELLKLRCELASNEQLYVTSLMPFALRVGMVKNKRRFSQLGAESVETMPEVGKKAKVIDIAGGVSIKEEQPDIMSDDEVTVLEEDDLVIAKEATTACGNKSLPSAIPADKAAPKIRCINIQNLLQTQAAAATQCKTPPLTTEAVRVNTPPSKTVRVLLSPDQYAKLNGNESGPVDANAKPKQITLRLIAKSSSTTMPALSSMLQTRLTAEHTNAPRQRQVPTQQQQQGKKAGTAEQSLAGLPIPVVECGNLQVRPQQMRNSQSVPTSNTMFPLAPSSSNTSHPTFNPSYAQNNCNPTSYQTTFANPTINFAQNNTIYSTPANLQYLGTAQNQRLQPASQSNPVLRTLISQRNQTIPNKPISITISHINGGPAASASPSNYNTNTNH